MPGWARISLITAKLQQIAHALNSPAMPSNQSGWQGLLASTQHQPPLHAHSIVSLSDVGEEPGCPGISLEKAKTNAISFMRDHAALSKFAPPETAALPALCQPSARCATVVQQEGEHPHRTKCQFGTVGTKGRMHNKMIAR